MLTPVLGAFHAGGQPSGGYGDMKRGGATPKTLPTGWVFLGRHHHGGITIRWRRGDREAYVLAGNKVPVNNHPPR
ncbi:MAG: hypothetical protein ACRDRV_18750 [Pseudonocardiaceae bacterium]